MLTLNVPKLEYFDEENSKFIVVPAAVLQLEHSLVSLSKWESKWEVPFLSKDEKTDEQAMDYIRLMHLGPEIPPEVFSHLPESFFEQINAYLNAKMTATWFSTSNQKPSREIVTAEVIYYWMFSMNIPMECENWHLNRLFTLIKVCSEKNAPPSKKPGRNLAAERRAENARRRQQLGSTG